MLTTTKTSPRSTRPAPSGAPKARPLLLLTLLAALAAGCRPAPAPIDIAFEVRFDGRSFNCSSPVDGAALTDLRFYVHDLRVRNGDALIDLQLIDDGRWQDGRVALLDFEDGKDTCVNGSSAVNRTVRALLPAPHARADEFEFTIGVPAELNHENPLLAPPPRNLTAMHWHWRTGYKFLRAGVETAADTAWMHLGSARCTRSAEGGFGCDGANRPRVRLRDFDLTSDVVVVDLARLFGPTLGDGKPWKCESGAAEEDACRLAFAELGLDATTGEVLGSAPSVHASSP